jgi:hypothetical protein
VENQMNVVVLLLDSLNFETVLGILCAYGLTREMVLGKAAAHSPLGERPL